MVILQKWEPVISQSFPSQIPSWIQLKGIPLHYWDREITKDIGEALGHFEEAELTPNTTRIRVLINGLNPLIQEIIIDFDKGVEAKVSLTYEKLKNYCTKSYRLTHEKAECSLLLIELLPIKESVFPVNQKEDKSQEKEKE